ncbi:MAG: hypothetical protein L3K06_04360 [Thermoplasmata archaeon]|nr:hypothetical protein [Thermoplasmata archaeon]
MADDSEAPFTIPGDPEPEPPADNAPTSEPEKPAPRKRASRAGVSHQSKSTQRQKADAAAEGVAELVAMAGTVLSPVTPLGGAYLLASSEKAQDVAAALAEVEPRVLKALLKAKKVTVYVELGSLALGFVAAVMIERDMLPDVAADIPFGPADVRLGELHAELMRKGVYDQWVGGPDDGTGGAAATVARGGRPPVLARG